MGLNTYLDLKSIPKHIARVIICYDALLQLRQKKILPKTGCYLEPLGVPKIVETEPMDKTLNKIQCEACALGTIFASRVSCFDGLSNEEVGFGWGGVCYDPMFADLEQYFDSQQLHLIEACFEGCFVSDTNPKTEKEFDLIEKFFDKYQTAESRLIAILKNIINNEGTFKPEQNLTRKRKKVDKK